MSGLKLSEAQLVDEQLRIAKAGAAWLAMYVLASTAAYSVADIYFFEEDGLYGLLSVAVWGLGYVLLVGLMRVSGWDNEDERGGILDYLGLGILTGIATLIGLIVLILPGLYLIMRWLPAFARLQHMGEGVQPAMSWSWEATSTIQKPLAIALVGPILAYATFFGIAALQEFQFNELSDFMIDASFVALNLSVSIAIAWMQLLGVATYRLIQQQRDIPIETFT